MNNKVAIAVFVFILVALGVLFATGQGRAPERKTTPEATQAQPTKTQAVLTEAVVEVTKAGFKPETLTIKVGTKVVWLNKSGTAAAVNSAVHPTHQLYPPLNLGQFNDGSSVQLVFDREGTYKYHNHLNPAQTATVEVIK